MSKKLTIRQTHELITSKSASAVELTQDYVKKIKESDLNAFITVCEDVAIERAKLSDERFTKGEQGLLDGVCIAVKDLFCTKGVKTTAASKVFGEFVPTYESTVTQKLLDKGAIFIGKTNMDEFAMGSSNENSAFGCVISPFKDMTAPDKKLVPGGSSGGSAAAVAAGLCCIALGSDTGGSIRQPASFTGLFGAKPSYGVCSRYGMVAYASSLDQAGAFASTAEDCALVCEAMSGFDGRDSTMSQAGRHDFTTGLHSFGLKGLRVGIPVEYGVSGIHQDISDAWKRVARVLSENGAEVREICLPHTKYAVPCYYIVSTAEASSNLARYDGVRYGFRAKHDEGDGLNDMYEKSRSEGFGEEVKRRIMLGTAVLSSDSYDDYFIRAAKVRAKIRGDFERAFADVDCILAPTTPNLAFGINDKKDPVQMYLNDVLTVPVSLAGLCAISVPVGLSKSQGLPIGLQVITNYMEDALMFKIAHQIEKMI